MMKNKIIAAVSALAVAAAAFPAFAASPKNRVYTFSGNNVVTDGSPRDYENVKLTDDISVTTSGDLNRKYAAVTTLENHRKVGTFPIYDTFKAEGSYIYLGCTNVNDNAVFTLNMPEIPAGSKVTLTYAKPTVTNNGSTIRNANDPYAYIRIGDRYMTINGDEFDTWLTKSVEIGEAADGIEFHCDKWGAIAISRIEIAKGSGKPLGSVTVHSTQYANLKINGIKFYADAAGEYTLTSLPEGEKLDITAQKDGYETDHKETTVSGVDMTVDMPLTCETDAVYYESDFGTASGSLDLDGEFGIGDIPTEDVTEIASRATFKEGGSLKLTDGLTLSYDSGIYANGTYITPKDNMEFTAVIDKTSGKTVITQNDTPIYVSASAPKRLSGISGANVNVEYIGIYYPDAEKLEISGSEQVSSVTGGICRARYYADPPYLIPDTKAEYTVTGNPEVTIDETGVLTVPGGVSGSVKVCASYGSAKGEMTVEIVPADKPYSYDIVAEGYPNLHSTADVSLKNVKDEFGNEVILDSISEYEKKLYEDRDTFDQTYISGVCAGGDQYVLSEIKNTDNIESYIIHYSDGTQEPAPLTDIPAKTLDRDGTVIVNSFDNEGGLVASVRYDMKKGDKAVVSDKGKKVIFAADGEFAELTEADATLKGFKVGNNAGVRFEIDPVYRFDGIGDVKEEKVLDRVFANGFYDMSFKKAEAKRGDIYVNGAMVGNNVDQADADRKLNGGAYYTAEDVRVDRSAVSVMMCDGSTTLEYMTLTKKPEFYERPQRVYVIGDSLACVYYGDFDKEVGGGRSGWGQQLPDFLNAPVTDLANSGQYAKGLYDSAFPGVIANAREGDILLIECGYNDRSYSTRDEMIFTVKRMISICRENGIIPILVTPNASAHDYKPSVVWSGYLRDVAEDTGCELIDLSQESYALLYSLYGDDKDGNITKNFNLTEVGGDNLHSSYAGAYIWAGIVAQGLKDLGYGDIVNTKFSYSFTDTLGNTVKAEIR